MIVCGICDDASVRMLMWLGYCSVVSGNIETFIASKHHSALCVAIPLLCVRKLHHLCSEVSYNMLFVIINIVTVTPCVCVFSDLVSLF